MEKLQNKKEHFCSVISDSLPLVSEAYYMVALKHVVHPDRVADFNVMIYLISGSMEIIEDGNVYELKKDTIFFLKSGVHHWGIKEYEVGTQWYYVHFYINDIDKQYTKIQENKVLEGRKRYCKEDYKTYKELPKIMLLQPHNDIKDKIAHLVDEFQVCSFADITYLNIEFLQILLKIYNVQNKTKDSSKVDKRIVKVIDFIKNNYSRNFSSNEIEEAAGLSYKYICSLFKEKSNMTIKEYQLKMRLSEAERLLCQTQCSIAEIALQLGFYDAFSFSKTFKREKGVSPKKFREDYVPRI